MSFEYGSEAKSHGTLSFPGKILAPDDENLYIADSNHHRVIITSEDGEIKDIIGNGESPLAVESFEVPSGILKSDRERVGLRRSAIRQSTGNDLRW